MNMACNTSHLAIERPIRLIIQIMENINNSLLTNPENLWHGGSVTVNPVTGFGSPNHPKARQRQYHEALFLSHDPSGGVCAGASRLAGVLWGRSSNRNYSAFFRLEAKKAGIQSTQRRTAMKNTTRPSEVSVPSPVVSIVNNHAKTTSLEVARVFEKRHDHVVRDIKKLCEEISNDFKLPNFGEFEIIEENASGLKITKTCYEITKDGFVLLAMGFTGKKAMQFKLAYIEAFNKMEAELTQQASGNMPTVHMKYCVKCHKEKPVTEFWAHRTRPDGRQPWCKVCMGAYNRSSVQKGLPDPKQLALPPSPPAIDEKAMACRISNDVIAIFWEAFKHFPKQAAASTIDETALAVRISNEVAKRLPSRGDLYDPNEFQRTWETLCGVHGNLVKEVDALKNDMGRLQPHGWRSVPKGQDVLTYVRDHYTEMEKIARKVCILSEILLFRSPTILERHVNPVKPSY